MWIGRSPDLKESKFDWTWNSYKFWLNSFLSWFKLPEITSEGLQKYQTSKLKFLKLSKFFWWVYLLNLNLLNSKWFNWLKLLEIVCVGLKETSWMENWYLGFLWVHCCINASLLLVAKCKKIKRIRKKKTNLNLLFLLLRVSTISTIVRVTLGLSVIYMITKSVTFGVGVEKVAEFLIVVGFEYVRYFP